MKNILNSHRKTEKILFRGVIMVVKRGDIFYADLSPVVGSEQGGVRPVLIVQNDVATDIRLQLYVLPLRLK